MRVLSSAAVIILVLLPGFASADRVHVEDEVRRVVQSVAEEVSKIRGLPLVRPVGVVLVNNS